MATPQLRSFQLDDSATGSAAHSVNLYRGDVNLPLKLVDLPGPHGLDLGLTAYYGSNVGQQWDTWNLDAPTGVLGLGWSLPYSYIGFDGRGTAAWLEGSFTLYLGGAAHPLVLLSYTGSAAAGDEALRFADPGNPLWTYAYTPSSERWSVQRDDGVTMVFGDSSSGRDTVQWGVRWGNWAGNSSTDSGGPERFALAWNLSTMSNPWGQAISYRYLDDPRPLTATLNYSRASYLAGVVDGYGRSIEFSYADKDPLEYQAPHTVNGDAPGAGYQDRYETQYLCQIAVYSPAGTDDDKLLYMLTPGYELKDPEQSQLTATCKRYLVSLSQQRSGIDLLPAMRFSYQLDPSQPGPGRLQQVSYPSGGTVTWRYADIPLADADDPDNVFNLSYTATRPIGDDYSDATPRLWFGASYVIVAWYNGSDLALRVYSYGGRWSQPYCYEIEGVDPQLPSGVSDTTANKLAQLRIATGGHFFALHYHNQGATTDDLRVFEQAIDQFGLWSLPPSSPYHCELFTDQVIPEETALVAGDDFIALHVGGSAYLYRCRYSPVTQAWTQDAGVSLSNDISRIALAAQNNSLAACWFTSGSSTYGRSVISWLNGDYAWDNANIAGDTETFDWNSGYVEGYWRFGPGFVVGTCLVGSTAHLQTIHWQRNFADFSLLTESLDGGEQTTSAGGSALFNAGALYRYNGYTWVKYQSKLSWADGDLAAATDDTVLAVRASGSVYNDNSVCRFDAESDAWQVSDFSGVANLETYTYGAGPQFAGDFLSVSNQVFYRGTEVSGDTWQPVVSHNPLPDCSGSTLINLAAGIHSGFLAWQNQDNRSDPDPSDLTVSVALPKNGDLLSIPAPTAMQRIQSLDGSGLLAGAGAGSGAFATFDADVSDFSAVGSFTLHRVLNHKLSQPTATAVIALTIDTGEQQLTTGYAYVAETALYDESGSVVQFPSVTATRLSAIDGSKIGQTIYQYYNGQAPANATAQNQSGETCLSGCGENNDFCAHYSLANGYLHALSEYNGDGILVAEMVNDWVPVTFDDTFTPLKQLSTLRSGSVTHSFPNLAVTNLDGSPNPGTSATLSRGQNFSYDPATALISSNSLTQYNSQGQQETRHICYCFAWSEYSGMKDALRLKELCRVDFSNTVGGTVGTTTTAVQSFAQTWSNDWSAGAVWDQQQAWSWLGAGNSSAFDFSQSSHDGWTLQSSIDARNPAGFIALSSDAIGTPALSLYDASGLWPIAAIDNSDAALYCGFESYESATGWTLSGGGAIAAGDAHSGRQCAHLPAGAALAYSGLDIDSGQWLFSCRVKSPASNAASWTLQTGADETTVPIPSGGDWQYLYRYLTVSANASAVSLTLANQSGTLLLDEVRLTPLQSRFSARVYDDRSFYPVARLGANGETARMFYDDRLRVVGGAGPDENLAAIQSLYYSDAGAGMFSAEPPDPNSRLRLRAADGGPWDDFRDSDWSARWSGDGDTWAVVDQVLTHQGDSRSTVTLNDSSAYSNYAVQVRVSTGTVCGTLGITIGDDLSVQWSASAQQWQLLIGGSTVASAAGALPTTPMLWLLIAGPAGVLFCVDDQPLLRYAQGNGIGGTLGLFADDAGVGFTQVLVALTPLTHISYLDGSHQPVQHQQLADNQTLVSGILRDELGRATVRSKPAIYEATVAGYQPGFISAFDWTSDQTGGQMSGQLSDYYAGQDGRSDDGGYPYHRQVLEDSSLARPQAAGRPGAAYAIGAPDAHTTSFQYGVNGASALFTGAAEQQYKLGLTIDPQGNAIAALTDLLGNGVGQVRGTLDPSGALPAGSLLSACLRDAQDNPAQLRSPNWFAPPSGDASDWAADGGFDYHNRPDSHTSSDEGQSTSIRDSQGRLRFKLLADGSGSGAQNPCGGEGATPVAILYGKYDPLGRITEQGYYCVTAWSDCAAHADDQDWPGDPPNWRYRRVYDGDGSQPYAVGRAVSMQTNNAGTVATESYAYDIRGKIISLGIDDGVDTALTTRFGFDCIGRPTQVNYPAMGALPALTVSYGYDARGLPATIGDASDATRFASYSHNAASQVASLTLGNASAPGGAITRNYSYTPTGWPRSIVDTGGAGAISSETLYYEQSNSDGSNEPRYDGLLSAVDYSRTADGADYHWTYAYDDKARLAGAVLNATGAASQTRGYSYDPNGNLGTLTIDDDSTTLNYDGSNRLQSAGTTRYSSAPSGEVTTAGALDLGYDFNSRLPTTISDASSGETVTLSYGSGAQRLRKDVSDQNGEPTAWRRYLPGPRQHALQEQAWDATSGQTTETRYVHGPHGIVALQTGAEDLFLLHDHQRSPRLLLAGAAAAPVALLDYQPFGGALNSAGSDPGTLRYRYAGQEWDDETALYNDRHRLYDPAIARFLAPDPARQYFSPYLYVGDHPLLLTDPSGEFGLANTLGVVEASAQIIGGVGMVAVSAASGDTAGMAAGGALIGGGVAGMDYAVTTKHFSEGQYLQIDAAATIATAEIEAGMLITAASGGTLANSVGGGLTGAGVGGYGSVLMQVNEHPNQKFSWKQYGIAEGTGAIIGAATGGIGSYFGPAADVADAGADSSGSLDLGLDIDDSASDSAYSDDSENGDNDDSSNNRRRFNSRAYWQSIAAKTAGKAVGGFAGETFNYSVTHKHFNAKNWVIDSAIAGGEQAATQFATGLVFEAWQPQSTSSKVAYTISKRALRTGIAYGWSQLVKRP